MKGYVATVIDGYSDYLSIRKFYSIGISEVKKKVDESKVKSMIDSGKKISVMRLGNAKTDINKEHVKFTKNINKADVVMFEDKSFCVSRYSFYVLKKDIEIMRQYCNVNEQIDEGYDSLPDDEKILIRIAGRNELNASSFITVALNQILRKYDVIGKHDTEVSADDINKIFESEGFSDIIRVKPPVSMIRISKRPSATSYIINGVVCKFYSTASNISLADDHEGSCYCAYVNDTTDFESFDGVFIDAVELSKMTAKNDGMIIDEEACIMMLESLESCEKNTKKDEVALYWNMIIESNFEASEMYLVWIWANYKNFFEQHIQMHDIKSTTFIKKMQSITAQTIMRYSSPRDIFNKYINKKNLTLEDLPECIKKKYIDRAEEVIHFAVEGLDPIVTNYIKSKYNIK